MGQNFSVRYLGAYFRGVRLEQGLSQRFVARQLSCSPQFLYSFEKGKISIPLETLAKMIKLYDLEVSSVVDRLLEIERVHLYKGLSS